MSLFEYKVIPKNRRPNVTKDSTKLPPRNLTCVLVTHFWNIYLQKQPFQRPAPHQEYRQFPEYHFYDGPTSTPRRPDNQVLHRKTSLRPARGDVVGDVSTQRATRRKIVQNNPRRPYSDSTNSTNAPEASPHCKQGGPDPQPW